MRRLFIALIACVASTHDLFAQAPTIASFTPTSGAAGSSVTITGTNFSPTPSFNVVSFGTVKGTVTAATATQLVVTVPAGSSFRPITVKTGSLTAYSSQPFLTTIASPSAISPYTFETEIDLAINSFAYGTALGDLDGDGKIDLITTDNSSSTISVYRNISTPGTLATSSFTAPITLATSGPTAVAIGDVDGDGIPDIVASQSGAVAVYRNTNVPGSITAAAFAPGVSFTGTYFSPYTINLLDLDGDGKPELIAHSGDNSFISVLHNTSTPGTINATSFAPKVDFATGYYAYWGVTLADFDGDGKPDIASTNRNDNSFSVLRNTTTTGVIDASSFAPRVDFSTGINGPLDLKAADFDGDGKIDVAIVNNSNSSISIFKNTGSPGSVTFTASGTLTTYLTSKIEVNDFNGDGKPDLAMGGGPVMNLFENGSTTGSISFGPRVDINRSSTNYSEVSSMDSGDIDGDGRADIVEALKYSVVTVYHNRTNLTSSCVPASERAALIDFYNSTNGSSWINHTNWLNPLEFTWFGVQVTGCHVTSISFSNMPGATNNLNGTLPASIGDLTELKKFDLGNNINLQGSIPMQIGNLTQLEILSMPFNQLSGSLPTQIGNLTNLKTLNLAGASLTGAIPHEIGNLIKLESLSLGSSFGTGYSGTIPMEIWTLTSLRQLTLQWNQLSGSIPPEVGNLVNLRDLNLSNNKLTGSIPPELANITGLSSLVLNSNLLSGSIPDLHVSYWLQLDHNNLSGPIPPNLLSGPQFIDLSFNQLTGTIPTTFGSPLYYTLNLSNNQLTGTIPVELGSITYLNSLDLSNNQLTGGVPTEINNTTNLYLNTPQDFRFDNNRLTSLPAFTGPYGYSALNLQSNEFTFEDLEPNGSIPNVQYAPQDSTKFTHVSSVGSSFQFTSNVGGTANVYQWYKDGVVIPGATASDYTIPNVQPTDEGLYKLLVTNPLVPGLTINEKHMLVLSTSCVPASERAALLWLYHSTNGSQWTLNQNWLSADESTWFGVTVNACHIVSVYLGPQYDPNPPYNFLLGNNLVGALPAEIGDLTGLQALDLSSNNLQGPIPATIGNLSNLTNLSIDDSQLSGQLPPSIGNLSHLTFFSLRRNALTGAVPKEIGTVASASVVGATIGLSNNDFTSLPKEIGDIAGLYLDFSGNALSDLPDLSAVSDIQLDVTNNFLDFADLEPYVPSGWSYFSYNPQSFNNLYENTSVTSGGQLNLPVSGFTPLVGGSANQLQWKHGSSDIPGAIAGTYSKSNVSAADAGNYALNVTSPLVPGLTITSYNATVFITGVSISGFSPSSGYFGTTVTVNGANFDPTPANNVVKFNGTTALVATSSSTSLTVSVPPGATTGPISVTVAGNTASSATNFTVTSVPSISGFTPASGPAGTVVTINGTNFNSTASGNVVYFGATRATVTAATTTQLSVIVPAGTTYQPITVQVNGLTASTTIPFIVTPPAGTLNSCSLAPRLSIPLGSPGSSPVTIAVADLDGDGKSDVITAPRGNNRLWIFRNTSTTEVIDAATLSAPIVVVTAANPYSIVAEDLDGDGRKDIASANEGAASVSVFRNTSSVGTISFDNHVDFAGGTSPIFITAHDIDGDGKPELIATNRFSNNVSVYQNTSSIGGFNSSSFAPQVTFAVGGEPYWAMMNDLNGDGKPELAVTSSTSNIVSIFPNTATLGVINSSTFAARINLSTGQLPVSVDLDDVDLDGKPDIMIGNQNNSFFSVFRNIATGTITTGSFASRQDFASSSGASVTTLSDLDGDAKPDVVVVSVFNNSISLFKNTSSPGTVAFTNAATFATGMWPGALAVADLDGDGRAEVLGPNLNSGDLSIFHNLIGSVPLPTITGFNPAAGPVGSSVTVTGTNFSATPANNIVKFNGVAAVVVSSTTTSIDVTVPASATSGPITVTVGCDQATSATNFNVCTVPAPPSVAGASRCGTGTLTLTASGSVPGGYVWYTVASGGTPIAGETNAAYITPSLSANTTYFVAINNGGCESSRTPVTAVVNAIPGAPSVTPGFGCSPSATVSLAASGGVSGQYRWYTTPSGGTPIAGETNGTFVTPTISSSSTYYVSIDNGICESARVAVLAEIKSCLPQIKTATLSTTVGSEASLALAPLVTTVGSALDVNSFRVVVPPISGAKTTITSGTIVLDYAGIAFAGTDRFTIGACDVAGHCNQQELTVDVLGEITIFNAISANGDGMNETFFVQNIELLPDTRQNHVTIFNRWGSIVFEIDNYDNTERVFRGLNNEGNVLPVGTYFYRIEFSSGLKTLTGFISLRQ